MNEKHKGSSFEKFLDEEGLRKTCDDEAIRRIREYKEKYSEKATVDPQVENPEKR